MRLSSKCRLKKEKTENAQQLSIYLAIAHYAAVKFYGKNCSELCQISIVDGCFLCLIPRTSNS